MLKIKIIIKRREKNNYFILSFQARINAYWEERVVKLIIMITIN